MEKGIFILAIAFSLALSGFTCYNQSQLAHKLDAANQTITSIEKSISMSSPNNKPTEKWENEVGSLKNEIKSLELSFLDNLRGIKNLGIPLSVAGFVLLCWAYFKGAKELAEKEVSDIIGDTVKAKKVGLLELIDQGEREIRFKKEKNIFLISANDGIQGEILTKLAVMGFQNVQKITLPEIRLDLNLNLDAEMSNGEIGSITVKLAEKSAYQKADLILLNDWRKTWQSIGLRTSPPHKPESTGLDLIKQMLEKSEKHQYFVGITNGRLPSDPKLNFANSEFTIYPRIIETLIYVEQFLPKQKAINT